jgi:transposase
LAAEATDLWFHVVCDGNGRPLVMLLSEGQMSNYEGAALMLDALPKADAMLGDKGYDADWFRDALTARGITACIPSKTNRKVPIRHDRGLYMRATISIGQMASVQF